MAQLWDHHAEKNRAQAAPLAERLRPSTFDDLVGQEHLLSRGKLLRRLIEADRLNSAIFHGPPGTGKTSCARLIAQHTKRQFVAAHAATTSVTILRQLLSDARKRLEMSKQQTLLFLDEIHRFSRVQQDALLADVEQGIVTLIGATTENPLYVIVAPLLSRTQLFQFRSVSVAAIQDVLHRAADALQENKAGVQVTDQAFEYWARICDGDVRQAINALELAVLSCIATEKESVPSDRQWVIDLAIAKESIQQKALRYDRAGDQHYDTASALIKSMRASDPNAAVYWLAKMLVGGEDPRFIARRIAIFASEDIGNADPQALGIAAAAFDLVERIGLPECQLTLAQAATYMATAPKSRAVTDAISSARQDVEQNRTRLVPLVLKDAHHRLAKKRLGHGVGYQLPDTDQSNKIDLGVDRVYYPIIGDQPLEGR